MLRGYKEISWQSAKGMMSEANFLRSLMEMDCDSIGNHQVRTVKGESAPRPVERPCKTHVMGEGGSMPHLYSLSFLLARLPEEPPDKLR